MGNSCKILKVCYPFIKCYPHHANLWATIGDSDYKTCALSTNYLQLVYDRLWNRIDFNNGLDIVEFVRNYPLINMKCYDTSLIEEHWGYYSKFVVDCIDNGFYVYLIIDRYYIAAYKDKYGRHSVHDMMIYGYDMEQKLFMVADYFDNQYDYQKITFHELDQARKSVGDSDWLKGVYTWKKNEEIFHGVNYQIDEIKSLLQKFIWEKKTPALTQYSCQIRDDEDRFIYGLGVYDELINNIEKNCIVKNNLDIRQPYVAYEHKVYLSKLCSELNHFSVLKNFKNHNKTIKAMQQKWEIILSYYIKYNLSKEEKLIDKMKNLLLEAKEIDRRGIQRIIKDITEEKCSYEENNYLIECCSRTHLKTWKNTFGKEGFDIVGDVRKYPDYFLPSSYRILKGKIVLLMQSGADQRGLEAADEYGDRQIGYIVEHDHIIIRMSFQKDNYPMVTCYFVDYDRLFRKIELIVIDAINKVVFVKESIENFENGIYVSFRAKEDILIKIRCLHGPDAVLSAIFWD